MEGIHLHNPGLDFDHFLSFDLPPLTPHTHTHTTVHYLKTYLCSVQHSFIDAGHTPHHRNPPHIHIDFFKYSYWI